MKYNKAIIIFSSITIFLVIIGFILLLVSSIQLKEYVDKYLIYEQVDSTVVNYVKKDNRKAIIVEYKVNQESYTMESKVFHRKPLKLKETVKIAYDRSNPSDAIWMPSNENMIVKYLLLGLSFVLLIASVIVGLFDYKLIKNNMKQEYIRQDNGFYNNSELIDEIVEYEKKIVSILIIFFMIPCFVKAEDLEEYKELDYIIDSYHINIDVHSNNTYDVEEIIDVKYNYQKRTIYRRIPLYNEFPRLDGLVVNNRVQISNLDVNEKYSKTIHNNDLVVKIGDNSKTLDNSHYVFKYKYNKGPDTLKGKDEFIFNIVGSDWDTVIKNISFAIRFPKDFDSKNVVILQGMKDKMNTDNVDYVVKDNVITGVVNVTNKPAEYVYARVLLDDGYFKRTGYKYDYKVIFMFVIPSMCLFICYLIWENYGKDEKLRIEKSLKIDKYNPIEAEYLYYGNVSLNGISYLILDLARRGNLKIRRIKKEEAINNTEEFIIEHINNDNLNVTEKAFIKGIFECKSEHTINKLNDNEVLLSDLANSFYNTLFKIQDNMNNKCNHEWLFINRTKETIEAFILMIMSLLVIVVIPVLSFANFINVWLVILLILIYLPFIGFVILNKRLDFIIRLVLLVFLIGHLFIMFSLTPLYDAIMYDKLYLVGFIYGMIDIVVMFICVLYMSKRTKDGTDKLGEITSFRKTLMNIKEDELYKLMENDKNYYYQILPYLYSLNITDYVKDKINIDIIEPPSYFSDLSDLPLGGILKYIDDFINLCNEIMSSMGNKEEKKI